MACLVCGASKTINAHLVPKAFATEVISERGEKHALVHAKQDGLRKTNTGIYDPDILCGPCDGTLGKHEGYVFDLLKRIRALRVHAGKILDCEPCDGDSIVKFAAGIVWEYANTKKENGRISIGPYSDTLKKVAFEITPIPAMIDAAAIQMQIGNEDVHFYRARLPDRKEGVNVIRSSVGALVFFLKIDKRCNPSLLPQECWVRGRPAASFLVAPADKFEEWTMHADLAAHPRVREYFDRMNQLRVRRQ
ncbi:hypothetical protein KHP60_24585 [Microvirga sp. 3-52]|uniref:hypothetical protein n=1 Tax=Microvirga sp. 3-52 TaxID=2792425 RepID=UPI001AC9254E|nr:hypothetical protein [Microvirga sp. 3-52]MBO1909469.1 hypothetical protein [Microvirga sp. 3-52]MBS7455466.1 hypothetical protein [Microvirga sp. 3-52]